MGRKGENIYKRRDKRWEGRYITSYNAEGKAVYKSVYGKSYTEVRLKMRNHLESRTLKSASISLAAWVESFLKASESRVKLTTFKIYERYLNNYIRPFFGNTILQNVSRELLQKFVNSLSDLSASTVNGIFSFLREALKQAGKAEYIHPVWHDIEMPKARRKDIKAFTRDEQREIENALDFEERPNDIGILLCLYTGLRIGEVCGLKWEDIDFDAGDLFVKRTVQRLTIDGKSVLRELPPKSETSQRKIPIPSFIADKLKFVKSNSSSQYILATNSHITDPRVYQYHYKKTLERAGVRYVEYRVEFTAADMTNVSYAKIYIADTSGGAVTTNNELLSVDSGEIPKLQYGYFSLSYADNGITIDGEGNIPNDAVLIQAIYDNNNSLSEIITYAAADNDRHIRLEKQSETGKTKFMLWSSLNEMIPIADIIEE